MSSIGSIGLSEKFYLDSKKYSIQVRLEINIWEERREVEMNSINEEL